MQSFTRALALATLASLAHCHPISAPPAPPAQQGRSVGAPNTQAPAAQPASVHAAPVSVIVGQTVRPGQWAARCQANQQCPAVPSIPQCTLTEAPRSFDSAWNDHLSLVGQRITVRGHLVAAGGCTEMACGDESACCNRCFGQVMLTAGNGPGATRSAFRFVEGEPRDGQFACTGDDSALCCGFAADGRAVVVTATLTQAGGAYVLRDAQFCTP